MEGVPKRGIFGTPFINDRTLPIIDWKGPLLCSIFFDRIDPPSPADGLFRADGFASSATDALRRLDLLSHIQCHGTGIITLMTSHAPVLPDLYPRETELLKEGVEGAQRAQIPAEATGNKDR